MLRSTKSPTRAMELYYPALYSQAPKARGSAFQLEETTHLHFTPLQYADEKSISRYGSCHG